MVVIIYFPFFFNRLYTDAKKCATYKNLGLIHNFEFLYGQLRFLIEKFQENPIKTRKCYMYPKGIVFAYLMSTLNAILNN